MTELYPTDSDLNNLSGTTDTEQEVAYPSIFESPYYTTFYKMLYRLLNVTRRSGDLRVYKDGDLTFGVRIGKFLNGDSAISFSAVSEQNLTDDATNYIYLTPDGTLTKNTTGFPMPSVTPHIRLATIATADGAYALDDITDYRGTSFLSIAGEAAGNLNTLDWQESVADEVNFVTSEPGSPTLGDRYINTTTGMSSGTSQSVTANYIYEWNDTSWTEITPNEGAVCLVEDTDMLKGFNSGAWVSIGTFALLYEAQTFFAATNISGAEAETLSDGSNADALHVHDTAGLEADAVDGSKIADGSVDTEHLAADAVDGTKIADDAVDSEHIADGSVDNVHLAGSITENKMAAAATQTISASNGTIAHNNKKSVQITLTGSYQLYTFGDTGNPQAIADGSHVGQQLRILVISTEDYCRLAIKDLASPAKTNLRGDWVSVATETSTMGSTYLDVEWDGSVWQENERYDGFGWSAPGEAAHAEGKNTNASGIATHAEGQTTDASAQAAHAEGFLTEASGEAAHAEGRESVADHNAESAHSSGDISVAGDAQNSRMQLLGSTATGAQTEIYPKKTSNERFTIATDTVYTFEILVAAIRKDVRGECASYKLLGCIYNNNGTTAIQGSVSKTVIHEDNAGWDVVAEADNTNDSLAIKVTGEVGKTIYWSAFVQLCKVAGSP